YLPTGLRRMLRAMRFLTRRRVYQRTISRAQHIPYPVTHVQHHGERARPVYNREPYRTPGCGSSNKDNSMQDQRTRQRRNYAATRTFPLTDDRGCIVPFDRSRIADRRLNSLKLEEAVMAAQSRPRRVSR
ncbi:MAG TPA: hypothetical protein VET88_03645, partial [Gammaproteobacteria bacterium]|nr:hypothetical protein [Gammaproteobacteria bacterium]